MTMTFGIAAQNGGFAPVAGGRASVAGGFATFSGGFAPLAGLPLPSLPKLPLGGSARRGLGVEEQVL